MNEVKQSSRMQNSDAAAQNADDFVEAVSAAMPPSMVKHKQLSADEVFTELNRIPLFMTSLDETDGEGGDNALLDAIKALAYEGTRAEVAANFREQGNEAARTKQWTDAREFYTKAIQAVRGQVQVEDAPDMKVTEVEDEEAEAQKERAIEEACLANRALCNLEMSIAVLHKNLEICLTDHITKENYGSCNRDCAATLRLNPRNIKAWYRAASACFALDKIPEAMDACSSGLQIDSSNAALRTLLKKLELRKNALVQLEQSRLAHETRLKTEVTALRTALSSRSIVTRATNSPPEMEDAAISLSDPQDPASALSLPVIFLYPLHGQTDFLKAIQEDESLSQHLQYILPLPWDSHSEYSLDRVECYMETAAGGLIKAGKKLPLIKLLGSGKVEIVDGLVRVFVVPKARAPEWIEQFKLRRGKQ